MLWKICPVVLICVVINLDVIYGAPVMEAKVPEQEIAYGHNAILKCMSMDKSHNFFLWILPNGDSVGPMSKFDQKKYDYEVMNGTLIIKKASLQEEGVYTCMAKGVRTDDLYQRKVRMVVRKDWEEVWEKDESVTYFRIIVVMVSGFLMSGGIYYAYRVINDRHRLPHYLEASDEEDSAEELFSAPGSAAPNEETTFFDRPSTSGQSKTIK